MSLSLIETALHWCRGRNPWVRLPFLFVFGYWGVRYWYAADYSCVLSPLTLGVHEFGHLIFSPLGMTWNIAGGTLMQVLAPLYGVYNFLKQDDYFAAALSVGWLSTSLFEAARYIADARSMMIPLVSPFAGDPIHDWNYLLLRWHMLPFDGLLGGGVRFLGLMAMIVCLGAGAWLCWEMMKGRS